jgi:hypothetical protein
MQKYIGAAGERLPSERASDKKADSKSNFNYQRPDSKAINSSARGTKKIQWSVLEAPMIGSLGRRKVGINWLFYW